MFNLEIGKSYLFLIDGYLGKFTGRVISGNRVLFRSAFSTAVLPFNRLKLSHL